MGRQASTGSWIAAVIVLGAVVVAGVFLARKAMQPSPTTISTPATAASIPAKPASAPVEHPIGEVQTAPANASTAAMPTLDDSDDAVASALGGLAGGGELSSLLVRPQIIARIVATIDALPRHELGTMVLPLRTPKGNFLTRDAGDRTVMDEQNASRYAPYMQIVAHADPQAVVTWYVHAYPLFQKAYQQLGYPKGYFNDRLIVVIDNLLAAPEPTQPPTLIRSKGFYIYADPALESLSAGQRLLLRTGSANAATIKAKLRAIRAQLVGQHLPAAPTSPD